MTLTKQQKLDMIRDVELRIAKEELAEMHIRNMKAIEDSDQPLRTLKGLIEKVSPPIQEVAIPEKESVVEKAVLHQHHDNVLAPKIMTNMKQKIDPQSAEAQELLDQSEIAANTPFKKEGLDSKTQWEFTGLENISVCDNTTKIEEEPHLDFNLQEHFDNAKSMFSDHDIGMER